MLNKGSYYVELEFLENFSNEYFIMRSKPLTGKTRYRYASSLIGKHYLSERRFILTTTVWNNTPFALHLSP